MRYIINNGEKGTLWHMQGKRNYIVSIFGVRISLANEYVGKLLYEHNGCNSKWVLFTALHDSLPFMEWDMLLISLLLLFFL